eukprot:1926969-Rhodomonas_salina.2
MSVIGWAPLQVGHKFCASARFAGSVRIRRHLHRLQFSQSAGQVRTKCCMFKRALATNGSQSQYNQKVRHVCDQYWAQAFETCRDIGCS